MDPVSKVGSMMILHMCHINVASLRTLQAVVSGLGGVHVELQDGSCQKVFCFEPPVRLGFRV